MYGKLYLLIINDMNFKRLLRPYYALSILLYTNLLILFKKNKGVFFVITLLTIGNVLTASAQNQILSEKRISVKQHNITLPEALEIIGKAAGYTFKYDESSIEKSQRISLKYRNTSVDMILKKLLGDRYIGYQIEDSGIINLKLNKSSSLDEIIITASRVPESVGLTASKVNVLYARDINNQEMISPDMSNILGFTVPGLALSSNTTSNRYQTLRGKGILILIDGIPQSTPLRTTDRDIRSIDPSVIERIEILKGATSIYGNGADGGIINYITKKPLAGKTFGSNTMLGLSGHIFSGTGYRVVQQFYGNKNKFDYIISGSVNQTGVRKDGKGEIQSPRYGLGETMTQNAFIKLGYNLNINNRLEFMYNYYNSLQSSKYISQKGIYGQTPSTGIIGESKAQRKEGTRFNHNTYLQYTAKNIFARTNLDASLYYAAIETVYDYRNPPRWGTGGQAMILGKKMGSRTNFHTLFDVSKRVKMSITYGVDLTFDKTSQPLVDGRLWVPEMKGFAVAPYIQLKNTIYQDFILKAGMRLDNIQVKIGHYTTVPNAGKKPVHVLGGKLTYHAVPLNVGLTYARFTQFRPFISFSQSFSIFDLGRVLRAAKTESTINQLNTKPVFTNNYEVGFNSRINRYLSLGGSIFKSKSKLGADLVPVDGFWVPERSPQYVKGFELNADISISPQLSFGAAYAYQEGKADVNQDGSYSKYLNGIRLAAPKFNAYLNYSFFKRFDIGLYYIHSGTRNRFNPNLKGKYIEGEGPVKSYDLVNLNATCKINNRLKAGLGIENLFNKAYYTTSAQLLARDAEYVRGNGVLYNFSLSYTL